MSDVNTNGPEVAAAQPTDGTTNQANVSPDNGTDLETKPDPINKDTAGVRWPLVNEVEYGGRKIKEFQMRRPKPGDFRGVALSALLNGDTGATLTVLPRIIDPIVPEEVLTEQLDVLDLVQGADRIAAFMVQK